MRSYGGIKKKTNEYITAKPILYSGGVDGRIALPLLEFMERDGWIALPFLELVELTITSRVHLPNMSSSIFDEI